MKSKKRSIGDVGIRLKPNELNILKNYTKHRKKVKKLKRLKRGKKSKHKKKKKRTVKNVEITEKKDPFLKIMEGNKKENNSELIINEIENESVKTIHVDNKQRDLSQTDPNIKKTVMITASLKPEKNKEGGGILIE